MRKPEYIDLKDIIIEAGQKQALSPDKSELLFYKTALIKTLSYITENPNLASIARGIEDWQYVGHKHVEVERQKSELKDIPKEVIEFYKDKLRK